MRIISKLQLQGIYQFYGYGYTNQYNQPLILVATRVSQPWNDKTAVHQGLLHYVCNLLVAVPWRAFTARCGEGFECAVKGIHWRTGIGIGFLLRIFKYSFWSSRVGVRVGIFEESSFGFQLPLLFSLVLDLVGPNSGGGERRETGKTKSREQLRFSTGDSKHSKWRVQCSESTSSAHSALMRRPSCDTLRPVCPPLWARPLGREA